MHLVEYNINKQNIYNIMSKIILLLSIILIVLIIFPSIGADQSDSENKIDEYIHHLIFIYREKVDHDIDFDVEKYADNMYIYMKNTDSMRVLCFNGNVVNDSIIFVFDKSPYGESFTGIEIEYLFDVDFYDYLPYYIPPNVSIYSKATFDLNYTLITPELIHCEPTEKIISDTLYNSRKLAEEFYEHHKKGAKINEIWEPFTEENWDAISNNKNLYDEWLRIYSSSAMENYSFNDFLKDFEAFEKDVMVEKYGLSFILLNNGLIYSIMNIILSFCFLFVISIAYDYKENKWIYLLSWIIGVIYVFILGLLIANAPKGYMIYQLVIPLLIFIILFSIIKSKSRIKKLVNDYKKRKKMKNKIINAIREIENDKEPYLTVSDIAYISDKNNSGWINKIKGIDKLRKYIVKNTIKWAKKVKKIHNKQKKSIPEHYKKLDKIFKNK